MMKKSFVLLLMLAVVFVSFGFTVGKDSSSAEKNRVYNCAMEVMESYNRKVCDEAQTIECEIKSKNYRSTIVYSLIEEHIFDTDDELRKHFSGAYIDDAGSLVVRLNEKCEFCKNYIVSEFGGDSVIFVEGTGSYYDGQKMLEKADDSIAALYKLAANEKCIDSDLIRLVELSPRTVYNEDTNTVSVVFTMSEEVERAYIDAGLKGESNLEYAKMRIDKENKAVLEPFFKAVDHIKAYIDNAEAVFYEVTSNSYTVHLLTQEWRPGRKIIARDDNNPGAGYTILSTGYRAKYNDGGSTYFGFVTCAHGLLIGNSIYITTPFTSTNKLGTILDRSFGEELDVSFIKMTNSNYTNGQAIYYTSSQAGVTQPGTVLDGTQASVAVNSEIYKSGQSSYCTSGYVANTMFSYNVGYVYLNNMFLSDRSMASEGDSGGVTYIVNSPTIYGKAVGLVAARITFKNGAVCTAFVKASSIKRYFGASAY